MIKMPKILVLFASISDNETYDPILKILKKNKISFDFKIYSAHKTPDEVEKTVQGD
ncbi:AIR carboxylase family protein, partial [Candidatus Woesearchaeota archaeon]|nr:AIR carboxylase family protein [Candidatus Woesearchaeota archaeon]